MIYKKFKELELSALGMGAMRLPTKEDGTIDEAKTSEMVDYAMAHGVNYYDTAWGYHNGESELVMGRCLKKHPREKFYLATKFPGYDLGNMDKVQEIFEKQLEKCGVEYFDFYLIHNVCEMNIEEYLNPAHGIFPYLLEQKKAGRIKHFGCSIHGNYPVMKRFLDAYGEHMEFCQLQINWVDWEFQDAKKKVELLDSMNIPVWVMEPLRGGKLAALAEEDAAVLKALRPDETIPAWAFRFLQSLPTVCVTLSGMSNYEQMVQNIETFQTDAPLNGAEMEAILALAKKMTRGVPCTACRYCTAHCPQELDIPTLIAHYNEFTFSGGGFLPTMAIAALPEGKRPAACVGCRSCETLCPQSIKISEVLADFTEKLAKK